MHFVNKSFGLFVIFQGFLESTWEALQGEGVPEFPQEGVRQFMMQRVSNMK
jgi:hypothetical protein